MQCPVNEAGVQSSSSWRAHMAMNFIAGPQRTFVKRQHTGPLGMQRAFYPEGDVCHVYLLHPPGGVVGGDSLEIEAETTERAAGFVTTPGATKFYRSAGQIATFNQSLNIHGGSLEWFPQENIYFDGASVRTHTQINITSGSRFMGWEIQVLGRQAGGYVFQEGHVDASLQLEIDHKPVLLDRLRVTGTQSLQSRTGLRGHSVYGTQIFYPFNAESIDSARKVAQSTVGFYMTAFDNCLIVRYLGDDSESARAGFSALWQFLRKQVNAREGIAPRIWST